MAANPWANMPPLPASAAPADTTTASPLRSSITAHAAPLASSAGHLPLHQPETGAADRILALAQASGHLAPGERALAFDSSAAVAGSASALSARTLAACVRLDQFHVERDRLRGEVQELQFAENAHDWLDAESLEAKNNALATLLQHLDRIQQNVQGLQTRLRHGGAGGGSYLVVDPEHHSAVVGVVEAVAAVLGQLDRAHEQLQWLKGLSLNGSPAVASARNLVEVEAEAELYLGALQRVTHSIAASIGR